MHEHLREKATAAPILMRVLMETVQRNFPQGLQDLHWSKFSEMATIAGCVALSLRLHFDVADELRTPLELAMRSTLATRYSNSEQHYEDCGQFVRAGLVEMKRSERPDAVFPLIATWVVARVFGPDGPDRQAILISRLAGLYERETSDYWGSPDGAPQAADDAAAGSNHIAKDVAVTALGSLGCLGIMGLNAVLSAVPVVIGLFIWLWLARSCSSNP